MGILQQCQQGLLHGVDVVMAPAFRAMDHVLGEETMDHIAQVCGRIEAVDQAGMHQVSEGVHWVAEQAAAVMDRLPQASFHLDVSVRYQPSDVFVSTGYYNGCNAVSGDNGFYGSSFMYSMCYQANPMLFFSAINSCWQMGVNPFLNPQFLFQMLMMLWMQQSFLMAPWMMGFMGVTHFIPGFSFRCGMFL